MSIQLLKSFFLSLRPSWRAKTTCFVAIAMGWAALPLAAQPWAIGLTVEQGTYVAGDPVPMIVTVVNVTDSTTCNPVTVDVHLTPDNNFRTNTDHVLTKLSGPVLAPGESFTWEWVQRMPGNVHGTFFVQAEVYTYPGGNSPCFANVVSPFGLEDAKITLIAQDHPETSLVSRSESGLLGNALSETPSISQDGRWIAFSSVASSLLGGSFQGEGDNVVFVPEINNNLADIFVRDQWTGEIERISQAVFGNDPDGPSLLPRLSADPQARWVAYHSRASNLVPGPVNNNLFDVYLHDRQSGETVIVSRGIDGLVGNGVSQDASVSADGRWVAFESEARNLVAGDTNNLFDIFVTDMTTGIHRRVNVTNSGVQATGGESRRPRISADGRHIVFESRATNFHSGGKAGLWEIYVHDRDANANGIFDEPGGIATIRLSVGYDVVGNLIYSDSHSFEASLSPDGRFVTFSSGATTLFSEPATGSIVLEGKPAETSVLFEENIPAQGTIGFQPDVSATGTIEFTANPLTGHSVQISDGVTNRIFEFAELTWPVGPDSRRVTLGATSNATRNTMTGVINSAFLIAGEQTMRAEAITLNGNPSIRITNLVQGETGNNQPIDDGNAPTLTVTGMGGAIVNQPAPGELLVIENNRTGPVTVIFFEEGQPDPTDLEVRILGVELGRTAKETSLNLLAVFIALGYDHYDLPELPSYLLSALLENPQDGDFFVLARGGQEVTFRFVATGPQFDVNNPERVLIGRTGAETRGNLMRAIGFFFDFGLLPAVIESTGQPYIFGETLADAAAQGSIEVREMPEPGHYIEIGDQLGVLRYRFDNERDQTDEEEENEIPVPPFEAAPGDIVRVYLVDGITLPGVRARLLLAIQGTSPSVSAFEEGPVIQLVNNTVGPVGNEPIVISPALTDEQIEEEVLPWAIVEGMAGGSLGEAIAEGDRVVFYPENLLHPRVIFEFRQDLTELSPDADYGVQLAATGAETEGNFLAAVYWSGLPRLIASEGDPVLPIVHLESLIGASGGVVTFEFSPSDPFTFATLSSEIGQVRFPAPGGTITVDDRINPPVVFEFTGDGSVSEGNIPVMISPVTSASRDNFILAINAYEPLAVMAVDSSLDGEIQARLIRTESGPIGGALATGLDLGPWVSIIDVIEGQFNAVEGEAFVLRDGINPAVTFEFVLSPANLSNPAWQAVEIGADQYETRDNLISAIKDSGLRLLAVPFSENDNPGVRLTHFSTGAVGNFPITILTSDPTFAVKGMSGGGSLTSGVEQVYLVDRDANENGRFDQVGQVTLELISKTPLGTAGNRISREPVVTADGRYVAFRSQADDLLPLTVTRSDGEVFTNIVDPRTYIGFNEEGELRFVGVDLTSEIARLTDADDFPDIYLYDRQTGIHRRVDVNRFGESILASSNTQNVGGAPRSSRKPAVNADGRFIVFESDDEPFFSTPGGTLSGDGQLREGGLWHGATNRMPLDGPNNFRDIYVHDQRFPSSGLPPLQGEVVLKSLAGPGPFAVDTGVHFSAEVLDLVEGRDVQQVQFYANGVLIGTTFITAIPNTNMFTVSWTPSERGVHRIVAVATDSRGRVLPISNFVEITINQVNVVSAPSVSIVNPTSGAIVTEASSLLITAQAADPDGSLEGVQFYVNGVPHGSEVLRAATPSPGSYPFSIQWSPDRIGAHVITAVARDNSGNRVSAAPVFIGVTDGSDAPTISVIEPAGGFPLLRLFDGQEPGEDLDAVFLEAGVAAGAGREIVRVEFFANGLPVGEPSQAHPFTAAWIPSGMGLFQIVAVATDDRGNQTTSAIVEINVGPREGVSPSVTISSPAEDLTITNRSVYPLAALASDSDGHITSVEFFLGGRSIGHATRDQNSSSYRLNYDFRNQIPGEYDLVAVARDNLGNLTTSAPVEVTVVGALGEPQMTANLSISGGTLVDGVKTFPLGQLIQSQVTASTTDGRVVSVEFFRNGESFPEVDGSPNPIEAEGTQQSFVYFAQIVSAGNFNMYAVATDNYGNTAVSEVVPFRVTATATGQLVKLTSPTEGSSYMVGFTGESEQDQELTGAPAVPVRLQIDSNVGVVTRVEFLVNNEVALTRTAGPFSRWDWLANVTGQVVLSARVTNSLGNVFQSDAVTITVEPFGGFSGNPADVSNNLGFITQTFFDVLNRAPSARELRERQELLATGAATRGDIAAKLLDHPEFILQRWVIATYFVVMGAPPDRLQLEEGLDLLADSALIPDPRLSGIPVPADLPELVEVILGSTAFFDRHSFSGLFVDSAILLDRVWTRNLGRTWRTFAQRSEQEALISSELTGGLGRENYLAELTVENYNDSLVKHAAMLLLLLDIDPTRTEVEELQRMFGMNISAAAEYVVDQPAYRARFDQDPDSFFGPETAGASFLGVWDAASKMYVKDSFWFGRFNDRHFNYGESKGWLKHTEHGWLYFDGGQGFPHGMWMWDHIQQSWMWTTAELYKEDGFLYSNKEGKWLLYRKEGTPDLREFRSHNGSTWSNWFPVKP